MMLAEAREQYRAALAEARAARQARNAAIVEALRAGKLLREIAPLYGLTTSAIAYIGQQVGLPPRLRGPHPGDSDHREALMLLNQRPALSFNEIGRRLTPPICRERVRQLAKKLLGETAKSRREPAAIKWPIPGFSRTMYRWLHLAHIWRCVQCGIWFDNCTAKYPRRCKPCNKADAQHRYQTNVRYRERLKAYNHSEAGRQYQREYQRKRWAAIKAGTWPIAKIPFPLAQYIARVFKPEGM